MGQFYRQLQAIVEENIEYFNGFVRAGSPPPSIQLKIRLYISLEIWVLRNFEGLLKRLGVVLNVVRIT